MAAIVQQKGIAIQNKKCAMCRTVIPADFLDKPVLLENLSNIGIPEEDTSESYQWYYEGRNGWWKYDERSNSELETAWSSSATDCVLLLAGALYRIDFQTMIQTRRNDHTRRRRVRRDTPTLPAKGIAGIKIIDNEENHQTKRSPLEDINPEQSAESEIHTTIDTEVILVDESNHDDEFVNIMRRMEIQETNGDTTGQHTADNTHDT
ncbi:E3 ubiquitin-protein ligase RNF146 [Eumeta japonica]|uniref:E3 ubiquitin-protein ligase n=1 Tax=Eumeta variegata TaxID=151549 RepID=A0A4C1YZJ1_EUMVA|nr:E3 ubiquitin-protein ligase RNF146 [Eumeta japonica]